MHPALYFFAAAAAALAVARRSRRTPQQQGRREAQPPAQPPAPPAPPATKKEFEEQWLKGQKEKNSVRNAGKNLKGLVKRFENATGFDVPFL